MNSKQTLTVELARGERLTIGDGVVVELQQKSGNRARLKLELPPSIKIEKARTPGQIDREPAPAA